MGKKKKSERATAKKMSPEDSAKTDFFIEAHNKSSKKHIFCIYIQHTGKQRGNNTGCIKAKRDSEMDEYMRRIGMWTTR